MVTWGMVSHHKANTLRSQAEPTTVHNLKSLALAVPEIFRLLVHHDSMIHEIVLYSSNCPFHLLVTSPVLLILQCRHP